MFPPWFNFIFVCGGPMAIEDKIVKTGIQAGLGATAGAIAAARGAAAAPHAAHQLVANQAAKAAFATTSSYRHAHKVLPALGAGVVAVGAPAVAAAIAAAPVVLGVAAVAAVGGAAYGIFKWLKD
jgi:hypothetical protein